jgi:hypothetical protein
MNLSDRDLLAKTIQAEAGNQSQVGMLGVGSVIMNRLRNPGFGSSLQEVILKPGQFSPWNSYTGFAGGAQGQDMMNLQPSQMAYSVADQILAGNYNDPTKGALNFYNPALSNPRWGKSAGGDWTQIGDHLFGTAGSKSTKDKPMLPNSNAPLNAIPKLGPINTGQPKKSPSLFEYIGKTVGGGFDKLKGAVSGEDPDASDRLAVALMSLSGNPDQFKPMIEMAVKDINDRKILTRGKNTTLEYLQKQANAGDNTAAAALRLVESEGPAAAIKAYMNARAANSAASNKTAANTKTYPNGLSISLFQDGTKQVRDGQGNLLTGPAATEAIKAAQADEIEQARLNEFQVKSASAKAGMVQSTVESILNVDSSLRNYAKAKRSIRDAIQNGQNISGLITQFFPDVSVEAAELRNARNALGLDVVGSVTFGALSKGELDLALAQGLPMGLNEPQLLEYIERRELALKKYRQSLMEAARIYANPEKDFEDYLNSISETEVNNPYTSTSDDELEQLYIKVMSGTSLLSAKKRQAIIDEANRRAEL